MTAKYKLSSTLNPNKVFLIKSSELEGRLDPSWYVYLKSIQNFKHKKVAFKNLLTENPQYGANEIGIERNTEAEPRYIRITDINDFGELEKNELGKTATVIEEKYFLKENDLLLARSGNTVGKSYLHKNVGYDCFFAGYMIRFKIDTSKVLPQYIFAYTQTNFYKKWVNAIQRTTGQPNINADEYKNLEIPLPDISTQSKVTNIYFNFLKQKQTNEAQAEKLLASIDDYLLKELGITLPKQSENTLKSRMFVTSLKEISGSRFDPNYHQKYFQDLFTSFKNGKYEFTQIRKYASFQAGYAFKSTDYVEQSDCLLITIKNIRQNQIDLEDVTFLPNDFYEQYADFQINKNDLLIAMTGATIGKVGIYNHPQMSLLNQRNGIIKPNNINSIYLMSLLNLSLFQKIILRNSNGGAQPNISETDIMRISIPLPPLTKQKEIAERITSIRQEAQKLKDKTKETMEKANKEIEKILLG
ncbi:MAG: restriction endonuclease subunit S [Leptospiraceae bacterium]|nr:restriction endonuclease subunit S [Leptospiraceae bacterium]